MYDAGLHAQRLEHEHEVAVGDLPYVADFRVDDRFIEVVGMNAFPRYRAKLEAKRRAYEAADVNVAWVFADDVVKVFQSCTTPLRFRVTRRCERCSIETHDLVKRVCRRCDMRTWHETTGTAHRCAVCGESFVTSSERRFCSRECYWSRNETSWPTWQELNRRFAERSIAQVARDIGVKPAALYMRLRRQRLRDAHR